MKLLFLLLILLPGCASMEGLIRKSDHALELESVAYEPSPYLSTLALNQCLNSEGIDSEKLLAELNQSSRFFHFESCTQTPLKIIATAQKGDPVIALNRDAYQLRTQLGPTAFGQNFWGALLISSIQLTSKVQKAESYVSIVGAHAKTSPVLFETDFYDTSHLRSDLNPKGIELEEILIKQIAAYVLKLTEPRASYQVDAIPIRLENETDSALLWGVSNLDERSRVQMKLRLQYLIENDVPQWQRLYNLGVYAEAKYQFSEARGSYAKARTLPGADLVFLEKALMRLDQESLKRSKMIALNPKLLSVIF